MNDTQPAREVSEARRGCDWWRFSPLALTPPPHAAPHSSNNYRQQQQRGTAPTGDAPGGGLRPPPRPAASSPALYQYFFPVFHEAPLEPGPRLRVRLAHLVAHFGDEGAAAALVKVARHSLQPRAATLVGPAAGALARARGAGVLSRVAARARARRRATTGWLWGACGSCKQQRPRKGQTPRRSSSRRSAGQHVRCARRTASAAAQSLMVRRSSPRCRCLCRCYSACARHALALPASDHVLRVQTQPVGERGRGQGRAHVLLWLCREDATALAVAVTVAVTGPDALEPAALARKQSLEGVCAAAVQRGAPGLLHERIEGGVSKTDSQGSSFSARSRRNAPGRAASGRTGTVHRAG